MLNTETFSEILEDLLQDKASEAPLSHWESVQDAFGFTSILTSTPHFAGSRKPQAAKAYQLKIKVRPVRTTHIFNSEQTLAFENLKKWAGDVNDNFTRLDLKRAYRLAVLKAHPDQGGNSESFQEVRKSYQILEALVKNEA